MQTWRRWGDGVQQILLNRQQAYPQIFDYFGIGAFGILAGIVRLDAGVGDLGNIVQKFLAGRRQLCVGARLLKFQPQTIQQALAPTRQALMEARGNRTQAAKLMGISRRTLHRKLAQWPELDVTDRG